VKELVAKGREATSSYKLMKTTTGVPNAHLHRYTENQLAYIKEKLGHILYFFGYTNHPTEDNTFDFFKFDKHSEKNLSQYYRFKQSNIEAKAKNLARVANKEPAPEYDILDPTKGF